MGPKKEREEPASLSSFFVFNPTLGDDELRQHEKILFFAPESVPANEQDTVRRVADGLYQWSQSLSERPFESLRCVERTLVCMRRESHFYWCIVIRHPRTVSVATGEVLRWHSFQVDDSVLLNLLSRCYDTFRLFNGAMQHMDLSDLSDTENKAVDAGAAVNCRRALSLLLHYLLPTLKVAQLPRFLPLTGLQFFPVQRTVFLTLHYVASVVESSLPQLTRFSVMFDGKLIRSGFSQRDMAALTALQPSNRSLLVYLTQNHPEYCESDEEDAEEKSEESEFRFLTGRSGLCPRVYLLPENALCDSVRAEAQSDPESDDPETVVFEKNEFERLVVARYGRMQMFWSLRDRRQVPKYLNAAPDTEELSERQVPAYHDSELLRRLRHLILPDVQQLYENLLLQADDLTLQEGQHRFLYLNGNNLAMKSSLAAIDDNLLRAVRVASRALDQGVSELTLQLASGDFLVARASHSTKRRVLLLLDKNTPVPTGSSSASSKSKRLDAKQIQIAVRDFEAEFFSNIFSL